MTMINMQLSKEEANEEAGISPEAPKYPYGLCICLDDDSLKKLGITTLPTVGQEMVVMARVKVTATRAYETQSEDKADSEQSVDLQITDMDISNAPSTNNSMASKLYGE
jgi:hypothetical protein